MDHDADLLGDIDLDSFAGGGGASDGMRRATGKPVDIAINHSDAAIAMHEANHPETRHYCESIFEVNPREACRGKRVRVAWFSPDCTHHSRAKGGQPRSKEVRGLADVVITWAREVKPRVICLENVQEFADWGPLDDAGKPIKSRKGEDFRAWLAKLVECGYHVEYRSLVASKYGAPTSRTRFYLVARLDGQRVRWPEPTHGEGTGRAVRTAAEIIDWSAEGNSIFGRKKPLAEPTLRRIAAGLFRYVINSADPFIVPITHTKDGNRRPHDIREPLRTITTAKGGELALVSPTLISPTLISMGYGERKGQTPRVPGLHKPLGTAVAGGNHHALVTAFLATHNGGMYRQDLDAPVRTLTCREHITAQHVALSPVDAPVRQTAHDNREQVRAFLVAYYKSERDGQRLGDPIRTLPTHDRFGLVTVHGVDYEIADVRLRMLLPRELFRGQDFPDSYKIDIDFEGRPMSKKLQIELAGNSVVPSMARALVAANVHERWEAVA